MSERKRLIYLILIMIGVSLVVGGIAITMLYRAAMDETRSHLVETAQSQARLIEAVARFDASQNTDLSQNSAAATISQIVDAHKHYTGFGRTGEFTLARREGKRIVFLLSHRHHDLENPKTVPWKSELAEPMRLALSGRSGTMVGLDYRGEIVLAAHEPVSELDLGIVAKIDLAEVRAPFVTAGLVGFGAAVVVVVFGSLLFVRVSAPIFRDLQDRETRLSAVLDTAVDAIITIDERGSVESLNQAACLLFGYAGEEVIGRNVKILMPPPYHEEHDGYLAKYLNTGEKKIIGIGREVVGQRKDGTTFPILLAVSEVVLPDRRLFTGIIRDVSDLKRVEQELRQLNEELEQRVSQRTLQLEEARDELVRKEKLATLGQLAGTVAHEVRNPLGVIKNAVYFLETVNGDGNEDVKDAFGEINRALNTSERIVSELLDYARDPKLEVTEFSIDEVIDQAVSDTLIPDSVLVQRDCREPHVRARADAGQIERILVNLIQNAVQAMPDGGSLTFRYHETDAGHVAIEIEDTGVGIKPDELEKVFEPLYSRNVKGIGLGLALSKRYAEINNGSLSVESEFGRGATFCLTLPGAAAQGVQSCQTQEP